MWGVNKSAIVVNAADYIEEGTPSIYIDKFDSLSELLENLVHDIAHNKPALKVLLDDREFVKALNDMGYKDIAKIIDATEKSKAGTKFFISESRGYPQFQEIDITDQYVGRQLASDTCILLQDVSKDSLKEINPAAYENMQLTRKKIAAQNKARKRIKDQSRQKKKEKELAKARKLLKESGEL